MRRRGAKVFAQRHLKFLGPQNTEMCLLSLPLPSYRKNFVQNNIAIPRAALHCLATSPQMWGLLLLPPSHFLYHCLLPPSLPS